MTCKWNGLFHVEEEFDDEDLLQAEWTVSSTTTTNPLSSGLQGTSNLNTPKQIIPAGALSTPTQDSNPSPKGIVSYGNDGQTTAMGLRGISAPQISSSSIPGRSSSGLAARVDIQIAGSTHSNTLPPALVAPPQDDFDDWDVDLADLDDCDPQTKLPSPSGQPLVAAAIANTGVSSDYPTLAKRMRPTACISTSTLVSPALRGLTKAAQNSDSRPPRGVSAPFKAFSSPAPSPGTFRSPNGCPLPLCSSPVIPSLSSSTSSFIPDSPNHCPRPVTPRSVAPRPLPTGPAGNISVVAGGLFQAVSPCPRATHTPRPPLHTPVLTNHLVQLVSASKKTPQRPRGDLTRPKTRRFPGPAGLLPEQCHGKGLDDIVVSVPQTPAHGAVARLRSEVPTSQTSDDDDFSGGAWAAMKSEMGLDERNPSCFLHSYSVVMVLRKAALKQLHKNKVPNMAVVLKSILHTHADAKAVFKDPTGEMQGTVHRRLLDERQADLKTGAVLLLKQVGVFSPSHRNHYLNVTPNNLLRIYPPDGSLQAAMSMSQHALGPIELYNKDPAGAIGGPVSQMELRFEDDEEEELEGLGHIGGGQQAKQPPSDPAPQVNGLQPTSESTWDTDDLDELLGELPVDTYSA